MLRSIPFNRPFVAGKELYYIAQAVTFGNIGGDGHFTTQCSRLLQERFSIPRVLLTPSCTAALEMAAMLCNLGPGDEVIVPSFTFVSTVNAFVRLGAKPVFVDIRPDTLNVDDSRIADAITPRTKAIFPVHYAGVACDMKRIMAIAHKHHLWVVEDAAQGVNAFYDSRALGSIGHLGTYSFHETKNYVCGEGGALCINDPRFSERAEIIRDKGTNRQKFFRGDVDKYTWVDVGSSYVPSEIACAFLYGQLEMLEPIATRRQVIYQSYRSQLESLEAEGLLRLPCIPEDCTSNYHLFYVLLNSEETRDALLAHLKSNGIGAVFHYVPLHTSPMGQQLGYREGDLPVTEDLSARLIRLPFYYEITEEEQALVVREIATFLTKGAATISAVNACQNGHPTRCAVGNEQRDSKRYAVKLNENRSGNPVAERLDWDSEHFGFEVGKISDPNIDDSQLETCLHFARVTGLSLVYWNTRDRCPPANLLQQYGGTLVDHRATYSAIVHATPAGSIAVTDSRFRVAEYPLGGASEDLRSLAIAAGRYSRFAVDGRFPFDAFKSLYETWIERSTRHELADIVLIASNVEDKIIGFVTVATTNEGFQIGLIATDEAQRGKGVGRLLMDAAHTWMRDRGGGAANVVTQVCNIPACRLYERCGYRVCQVEKSFHFWLNQPGHF